MMGPSRREWLIGLFIAQASGIALTYLYGRDLNWDQFNYHLYAGLSVFQNRLTQDFLPASIQTYLNPLPYAPFYLMVKLGFPSFSIAAAHATVHALNPLLVYGVSRQVLPKTEPKPHLQALVCAALGSATAVFHGEFGTTFMDITTSVPVLVGVLLLTRSGTTGRDMCLAGAMLGIATGLKLTNICYAAAALLCVATLSRHGTRLPSVMRVAAGSVGGFTLSYGIWGLKLWWEFGNPFYPYFNRVFKSPDFPAVSIRFDRFVPQTAEDWLLFPIRMVEHRSWHYTEAVATDLRPVTILACAIVCLTQWAMRRRRPEAASTPCPEQRHGATWLLSFACISSILWMLTSSNGRYALPLLMLLGPVAALALHAVFSPAWARVALLGLCVLQYLHMGAPKDARWNSQPWSPSWFEMDMPAALVRSPHLHLSVGMQSHSFVAAFVHPESAFVNLAGQHSLSPTAAGGNRLSALMTKHRRAVRVLSEKVAARGSAPSPEELDRLDRLLDTFLLSLDRTDCLIIGADGGSSLKNRMPTSAANLDKARPARLELLSCGLTAKGARDPLLARQERDATQVFSAFEAKCPTLFRPPGAIPTSKATVWTAYYMETDLYLTTGPTGLSYYMARQPVVTFIGPTNRWQELVTAFECKRPRNGSRAPF